MYAKCHDFGNISPANLFRYLEQMCLWLACVIWKTVSVSHNWQAADRFENMNIANNFGAKVIAFVPKWLV